MAIFILLITSLVTCREFFLTHTMKESSNKGIKKKIENLNIE